MIKDLNLIIDSLTLHASAFAALGATLAFIFGVIQFSLEYRHKVQVQEFEAYHRLIKELVSPTDGGAVFMDRQAAVAFELRHFPRYYEITQRILHHLLDNWGDPRFKFLYEEISRTLEYIAKKRGKI